MKIKEFRNPTEAEVNKWLSEEKPDIRQTVGARTFGGLPVLWVFYEEREEGRWNRL